MFKIYVMESGTGKEIALTFDSEEKAEQVFLEHVGYNVAIKDDLGVEHSPLDTAFGFAIEPGYMNLERLQKAFGVWKKK